MTLVHELADAAPWITGLVSGVVSIGLWELLRFGVVRALHRALAIRAKHRDIRLIAKYGGMDKDAVRSLVDVLHMTWDHTGRRTRHITQEEYESSTRRGRTSADVDALRSANSCRRMYMHSNYSH